MLSREFSPIFGTRKTTSTGDDVVRIRKVKRKRSVKRTETYDFGKDVLHEPIENVVTFMKVLGQGQFGKVCLGVSKKTDAMVAYKEMNKHKNSNTIEKIANEIYIMRKVNSLCSPNLVELISVVERPQFIYIVMEALDGGELFYRIQKKNQQKTKYSESDAACFMRTIAGAVKSLHDVGIVHRDLKPENLIFRTKAEDSELVIIDFGLAWDMKGIRPDPYEHRAVGTPGYLAPEFIKAHEDSFHVTKASDVFSLGVILYILLVGFPPFTLGACKSHKSHAIATAKMYKKMLNEKYELKKWGWRFISDSAKSLVVSMLRGDPSERPSIDEVLSHEWFNRQRKSKQILNTTIERIRKFNVCRKWRKAVRAIVMMNRLQSLVSESSCIPRKEKNITLSSSSSSSSSKSVIVVKRRRRE